MLCVRMLQTQNMLELKMHLEELQMENEYQLRLKDMNYNEKIREITDNFTQQIEALQTTQQVVQYSRPHCFSRCFQLTLTPVQQ